MKTLNFIYYSDYLYLNNKMKHNYTPGPSVNGFELPSLPDITRVREQDISAL